MQARMRTILDVGQATSCQVRSLNMGSQCCQYLRLARGLIFKKSRDVLHLHARVQN